MRIWGDFLLYFSPTCQCFFGICLCAVVTVCFFCTEAAAKLQLSKQRFDYMTRYNFAGNFWILAQPWLKTWWWQMLEKGKEATMKKWQGQSAMDWLQPPFPILLQWRYLWVDRGRRYLWFDFFFFNYFIFWFGLLWPCGKVLLWPPSPYPLCLRTFLSLGAY